MGDAGLALLALLATTTLAVYKPRGMTRHGWRKQRDEAGVGPDRESITGTPRWVKFLGIIAVALLLLGRGWLAIQHHLRTRGAS